MRALFREHPVLAIMRNIPLDIAVPYAEAAYRGGVRLFEVAMNSKDGLEEIRLLKAHLKDRAIVGAGTVTTTERCVAALDAGAAFFLSPSTDTDVLEFCRAHGVRLLPGVMTPSDVSACLRYGFDVMKLFPAGDLPGNYIRSLKGPFDGTDYVAVGGVNAGNLAALMGQGYIGAGIGSGLIPREFVDEKRWDEAAAYVASLLEMIKK